MQTLSSKQKKVLKFICQKITRDNTVPTIREIAGNFGFSSTGTVRDYLKTLDRKGYIKLNSRRARGIELRKDIFRIPLMGRIAAGVPELANEDFTGYIKLDEFMNTDAGLFALRVKGDSMIEAGILEGDIVVVRRQQNADEGDIVVALAGDEATVKFFKRRKKEFFLVPANKRYKEIAFEESTRIIGKVVSVVRKYV